MVSQPKPREVSPLATRFGGLCRRAARSLDRRTVYCSGITFGNVASHAGHCLAVEHGCSCDVVRSNGCDSDLGNVDVPRLAMPNFVLRRLHYTRVELKNMPDPDDSALEEVYWRDPDMYFAEPLRWDTT